MAYRSFLKHIDRNIEKTYLADYGRAVFILHYQLNLQMWPDDIQEKKPLLIFIESAAKGNALSYHKKKLVYVLSSMRHFALECHKKGYPVYYHSAPAFK